MLDAATKLRRLHAENEALRDSLRWHIRVYRVDDDSLIDQIMALEMNGEK